MSLRMKDFECPTCGRRTEEIVVVGERISMKHCGKPMKELVGAPAVHYNPHYSHALGRKVNTFREEEVALAKEKNGAWIASKSEANRLYDTDHFSAPVTVKKRKQDIRKIAETQLQKLTSSGVISSPD